MTGPRLTGLSAITLAVVFNIPYEILILTFDYPDILRQPAGQVLDRFAAGGPALVLTWYGFLLTALALVPMSAALAITRARLQRAPALAIGAAMSGALAGLVQAIGLSRWVFVVPALAATHSDPAAEPASRVAAEQAFAVLNLYGGVAIGEHLGQLLTALFVLCLALIQIGEGNRRTAGIGGLTAATLAIGTGEGLAIALGRSGDLFSFFTIGGFLGLTVWLIATGALLLRRS
jgi:hypothetical protein